MNCGRTGQNSRDCRRVPIKRQNLRDYATCYGLLLPTLILLAIFCVVPFFWAFKTSLYRFEIGGENTFIGLGNYREYLQDLTFWKSIGNMLFLTAFAVVVNILVPLVTAKLIFSLPGESARYRYRVLFLLPLVVPGIVIQLVWRDIVYADAGLINSALDGIGLHSWTQGWLSNPKTTLKAMAFIGFPFTHGINILIFYAGLTSISESVHEAAWLDGAGGVRKFLAIDVPLVFSQVKLLIILTIVGGIQAFEGIFIITRGGPGFQTMVPGLWMYFNAFSFQKMGYACAIGVLLFLIILILTVINLKYVRSTESLKEAR